LKKKVKYPIVSSFQFKKKTIDYLRRFDTFCVLDSNQESKEETISFLAAFNQKKELQISSKPLEDLDQFINQNKDWVFGFLTYDIKNNIENLSSRNLDYQKFPLLHFFIPEIIVKVFSSEVEILYDPTYSLLEIKKIFQEISELEYTHQVPQSINLTARVNKKKYISTINTIKKHLQFGDIYELNYCQEFYKNNVDLDPYQLFVDLNNKSSAPFSSFYKIKHHFCLCASPERFLKKDGHKIISQPIKGTIIRDNDIALDEKNKNILLNSSKDFSENVMIVDLVRNDLSRIATQSSVKVDELAAIYSYQDVHHLISTISCEIDSKTSIVDVLKASFPMGSMTGAPKIKAMDLIEKYEDTLRGIYSGSIGYITPNHDFDFNVVIRSIFYNSKTNYLSFMVGGAITIESDPELEYDECFAKAQSIFNVLNG